MGLSVAWMVNRSMALILWRQQPTTTMRISWKVLIPINVWHIGNFEKKYGKYFVCEIFSIFLLWGFRG